MIVTVLCQFPTPKTIIIPSRVFIISAFWAYARFPIRQLAPRAIAGYNIDNSSQVQRYFPERIDMPTPEEIGKILKGG